MNKDLYGKLVTMAVYAITMAVVESVLVVYLRLLYYAEGFNIESAQDLFNIPENIYRIELLREISTLTMIGAVAWLAFKPLKKKVLAYIWTFAIWDIFYYIFLYVFLRWPENLATADVYFLLPVPITGPVWFPLILFIILGAFSFYHFLKNNKS